MSTYPTIDDIRPGDKVEGIVKNISDLGAYLDLHGIDGLLHISDMAWGRLEPPSLPVTLGQKLTAQVLAVNREKNRVSLALKQMLPHPWDQAEARYPVDSSVKGAISKLALYGAFLRLEEDIEGLIPVSEISRTKRIAGPSDVFHLGQEVEARVLSLRKEERKIILSVRQVENGQL